MFQEPPIRHRTTTKTKLGIPTGAVRWWKQYGHNIIEAGRNSMLAKAAAEEYRQQFNRDFWNDFDIVQGVENQRKELKQ